MWAYSKTDRFLKFVSVVLKILNVEKWRLCLYAHKNNVNILKMAFFNIQLNLISKTELLGNQSILGKNFLVFNYFLIYYIKIILPL